MIKPGSAAEFENNANSTPPTFAGSVFNSFKGAALTGLEITSKLGESSAPQVEEAYANIQAENQKEEGLLTGTQMNVRRVASALPNILGSLFDPVSMATGYVGGVAGEAAIHAAAPKIAERQLARKVLIQQMGGKAAHEVAPVTIKELGAAGAHGAAVMAGFGLPGAIGANLDEEKNINWGGVAKEEMANGAMGFALPIVGYGMGVLWRHYFPDTGKIPIPKTEEAPEQLKMLEDKFNAGEIPKHEFDLMRDYLINPNDPTLKERFNQSMLGRNQKTNSANYTAYFEMLSDDDMNNLKSIIPQELNDHELASDKNALSQFTLHNRLDEIRDDPHIVNGLHGFIDTVEHKIANREKILKEADKLLDSVIHHELGERAIIDQEHLSQLSIENKNYFTIPDNIIQKSDIQSHEIGNVISVGIDDENRIKMRKDGDSLKVTSSGVENPGLGLGKRLYKAAIKEAQARNLKFASDRTVSDDAMRVYKSLEKDGYKFKYNENARRKKINLTEKERELLGGDRYSTTSINDEPVIELVSSPKSYKLLSPKEELNHIREKLLGGKEEDTYYRGAPFDIDKHGRTRDPIFGNGYWMTPNRKYARGYGKNISIIRGKFKILNWDNLNAEETLKYNTSEKLREFAKKQGYDGLQRDNEIMLFEKPKSAEKYTNKKELPKNHTQTKEYKRLTELADAWPQAQALLDRIKLEHEYERQEAIRDVAKAFVDVLNSNIDRFANGARVESYLKERINQATRNDGDRGFAPRNRDEPGTDVRGDHKLPADESQLIEEFQQQVDSVDAPELKKDFKVVKERYEQFRDNEKALAEMVDCFGAK